MYAFIKHIKTSMENLPAPTQVMGYDSFDEMKESGHYKKLLDQFKDKILNENIDTIFKLRKIVNRVATDKQISRVSELEKRDYGIRYIKQNARKMDKIIRNLNTYLDETVSDHVMQSSLGVKIRLNRSNTRYNVRLRSDMDSRERIEGIPNTLNNRTTYDISSRRNRGFSKYVSLSLPLYILHITLERPTMDVSNGTERTETGSGSFKVPLNWDLNFLVTWEIGKYLPKLLLEDFVELDNMENYKDLLNYIDLEIRKERDGDFDMVRLDTQNGDRDWNMNEDDSALVRQHYYNRHGGRTNSVIFVGINNWRGAAGNQQRPIYPHPFISSHDTHTPCWAGWREDLDEAGKALNIKKLAFLIKGWATIYNASSHPHHGISQFMLGLPKTAKDHGFKATVQDYDCWNKHKDYKLCESIECTLKDTCHAYASLMKTSEDKSTGEQELQNLEPKQEFVNVDTITIRRLSQEEKQRLLEVPQNNNQGENNE
jgi:hypothetical protein